MSFEDLERDIIEYERLGDMEFARALLKLTVLIDCIVDEKGREVAKDYQDSLRVSYPDYPKINVL